jgi:DMSO/TMAO reductase YedYZ molybdopterin-dependent catalytic subunit
MKSPAESPAIPRSPVSWETPLSELLQGITSNRSFFVRHHAVEVPQLSPDEYRFTLVGAQGKVDVGLEQLQRLPRTGATFTLECAGNGRCAFDPVPHGVPWGFGAISTARWDGAMLRDVLDLVTRPADATHVVFDGFDGPVSATVPAYRRSLPLSRALSDATIVVDRMNGEPLPVEHGGPARLLVGGWTANHSVKWLRRIGFAAAPDDGYWMASEYRVPGEDGALEVIERPSPKAIIATPADETECGSAIEVRGIAFGSPNPPAVLVAIDDGSEVKVATREELGEFAWAVWSVRVEVPPGRHSISVRAIDSEGRAAPKKAAWDERGYCYHGPHTVHVLVS